MYYLKYQIGDNEFEESFDLVDFAIKRRSELEKIAMDFKEPMIIRKLRYEETYKVMRW